MHVDAVNDLPAGPAAVAALLASPEFVRSAWAGDYPGQVEVTGSPEAAFTVTIRRSVALEELPAQIRGFLTTGLDVRQINAWEPPAADGGRRGTIAAEILGAPVRLTGTLALIPVPAGTRLAYSAEIRAQIPLFAGKIEQAAANLVASAVAAEREGLAARLTPGTAE